MITPGSVKSFGVIGCALVAIMMLAFALEQDGAFPWWVDGLSGIYWALVALHFAVDYRVVEK